MSILNKVKLLLGDAAIGKDELIAQLIGMATLQVINYTHNNDCANALEDTIAEMVVYNFNRLGSEGLNSEGYSGVSFSYSPDYPNSIMRSLNAYRKLRVI